jgi:hypothetical protein
MKLPKKYRIRDWKQKSEFLGKVVFTLNELDKDKYPNVCRLVRNDSSKIELIEMIIVNVYSSMGNHSIATSISNIETTLSN